jgi:hypothetical protein
VASYGSAPGVLLSPIPQLIVQGVWSNNPGVGRGWQRLDQPSKLELFSGKKRLPYTITFTNLENYVILVFPNLKQGFNPHNPLRTLEYDKGNLFPKRATFQEIEVEGEMATQGLYPLLCRFGKSVEPEQMFCWIREWTLRQRTIGIPRSQMNKTMACGKTSQDEGPGRKNFLGSASDFQTLHSLK